MEGGNRLNEGEQPGTVRATQEQLGNRDAGEDSQRPRRKVPTTPGAGGGVAETGTGGAPGPATRPSGGAKDPNVAHDIPPSAREQ